MPGSFIHIKVAEKIREQFQNQESWLQAPGGIIFPSVNGPSPRNLAEYAFNHPNYYRLGAVGPDLFFFLPDYRAGAAKPLIKILETLDDIYAGLDDYIIGPYEHTVGPAAENFTEAINNASGGVVDLVTEILGKLTAIEIKALMDIATQSGDLWENFSLGLNKGYDNKDFFWSDMLHYRKTSEFAANMWNLLNGDEQTIFDNLFDPNEDEKLHETVTPTVFVNCLRAYVLGYMTHLGTDTTGHAFVNQKCGGPFRTHWQRHHLVENHMDAKSYDDEYGMNSTYSMLTESALYFKVRIDEDGKEMGKYPNNSAEYDPLPYDPNNDSLHERYKRRRHLDLDAHMPGALARLLIKAMENTYNISAQKDIQDPHGILYRTSPDILPIDGAPKVRDIQEAYMLWFRYMKYYTLDGFNYDKPKVPSVFADFEPPFFDDPNEDKNAPGYEDAQDRPFILKVILFIIRLLLFLASLGPYIAGYLADAVTGPATIGPRLAAYYGIEIPLYYILKGLREVMVMTGYSYPMKDEIDTGLTRIGTGSAGLFSNTLKAMDDALAQLGDNNSLAQIQQKLDNLLNSTDLTVAQALANIIGELDLSSNSPSEPIPDNQYPHSHPDDEYHHPWSYPTTEGEMTLTKSGTYLDGDVPHILLEDNVSGNQDIRIKFEKAPNPQTTHSYYNEINAKNNLGDPVNFSSYLIWQLTRSGKLDTERTQITNWNLDSDKGYAYKCWDWNRHLESEIQIFPIDEDGHPYLPTCTPPPQSNKAKNPIQPTPPTTDLQLYYIDESPQNPGCQSPNKPTHSKTTKGPKKQKQSGKTKFGRTHQKIGGG